MSQVMNTGLARTCRVRPCRQGKCVSPRHGPCHCKCTASSRDAVLGIAPSILPTHMRVPLRVLHESMCVPHVQCPDSALSTQNDMQGLPTLFFHQLNLEATFVTTAFNGDAAAIARCATGECRHDGERAPAERKARSHLPSQALWHSRAPDGEPTGLVRQQPAAHDEGGARLCGSLATPCTPWAMTRRCRCPGPVKRELDGTSHTRDAALVHTTAR